MKVEHQSTVASKCSNKPVWFNLGDKCVQNNKRLCIFWHFQSIMLRVDVGTSTTFSNCPLGSPKATEHSYYNKDEWESRGEKTQRLGDSCHGDQIINSALPQLHTSENNNRQSIHQAGSLASFKQYFSFYYLLINPFSCYLFLVCHPGRAVLFPQRYFIN